MRDKKGEGRIRRIGRAEEDEEKGKTDVEGGKKEGRKEMS